MTTYAMKTEKPKKTTFNIENEINSIIQSNDSSEINIKKLLSNKWREENKDLYIKIQYKNKGIFYSYRVSEITHFNETSVHIKKMNNLINAVDDDSLLIFSMLYDKDTFLKSEFVDICREEQVTQEAWLKNNKIIKTSTKADPSKLFSLLPYYYDSAFDIRDDKDKLLDSMMKQKSKSSEVKEDIKKIMQKNITKNELNELKRKYFGSNDMNRKNNKKATFLLKNKENSNNALRQFFYNEIDISDKKDINTVLINNRFNIAQIRAVDSSLNGALTILQGPPGTGKSTTIINIIISAVLANKTVLVSSNNNLAVDGVMESLEKIGLNQFWWRFGNKERAKKYLETHSQILLEDSSFEENENEYKYSRLFKSVRMHANKQYYKSNIKQLSLLRKKMENNIKKYKHTYNEYSVSKAQIMKMKWHTIFNSFFFLIKKKNTKNNIRINSISKMFDENEINVKSKNNFKKYISELSLLLNKVINDFNQLEYLDNKIEAISKKIKQIEDLSKNVDGLKKDSMYFEGVKQAINKKFSDNEKLANVIKNIQDKEIIEQDFVHSLPVTFTTNKSYNRLPIKKYDYVIIDEAGQANIKATLPIMTKGNNVILSGDTKQLEPIYSINKEDHEEIAEKFNIDDDHLYKNNSVMKYLKNMSSRSQRVFLEDHYRCDPNISSFFNRHIYDNQLMNRKIKKQNNKMKLIVSEGKKENKKNINNSEIVLIMNHIKNSKIPISSVGIITPFKDQKDALKKEIAKHYGVPYDTIENVGTVHAFQGKEYERIYFSSVLSSGGKYSERLWEFLNNENLINVAVSRAKSEFILVTSRGCIEHAKEKYTRETYYKLWKFIALKEYKNVMANKTEAREGSMFAEIPESDLINKIRLTKLSKKAQEFAFENNFMFCPNVFKRDILQEKDDFQFDEVCDVVLTDKEGNVEMVIFNDKVIFIRKNDGNLFNNYISKDSFLSKDVKLKKITTRNENDFWKILLNAYEGYIVAPNVAVKTVIDTNELFEKSSNKNHEERFKQFHYDFVIYKQDKNKKTLTPIHVIELDDKTHIKIKNEERDIIKDKNSAVAGIKVHRFLTLDRV